MTLCHRPLGRYVKLGVAHAPGMTGTFSPPPLVSDPGMHHGTCVTHVPWCMPGSLTSSFLWSRCQGNVPGIPGACKTQNVTYVVKGPWIYISMHPGHDRYYDYGIETYIWGGVLILVSRIIFRPQLRDETFSQFIYFPLCQIRFTIVKRWMTSPTPSCVVVSLAVWNSLI